MMMDVATTPSLAGDLHSAVTLPEDGCCPLCGIRLYKIVHPTLSISDQRRHSNGCETSTTTTTNRRAGMKKWRSFARGLVSPYQKPKAIPLTIQGKVLNGHCLTCTEEAPIPSSTVEDTFYLGEYNAFGLYHGQGELIFPTGERFVGQFFNGKRFGQGTLWSNGSEFHGSWAFDLLEGSGTCRFANGDVFEGEYSKGCRSGQGKLKLANGDLFCGAWDQDKYHGKGRYYSAGDSIAHEGHYSYGSKHGKFKIQHPSGKLDIVRYENDEVVGEAVRWSKDRKKTWLLTPTSKSEKKKGIKNNTNVTNPLKYYKKKRITVAEAVSIGYDCDNEEVHVAQSGTARFLGRSGSVRRATW